MSQRNHLIDLWRGVALIMIFINHVPGNLLERYTSRNFGFSDGAEAFVFIAGFSLATVFLIHGARAGRPPLGLAALAQRCWSRAFKLYRIHVVLSLCVLAIFVIAYGLSGDPHFRDAGGRGLVFDAPAQALPAIAMLLLQFDYVNILPLYVVLMLGAPVMLALLRRNVVAGVGVSIALYICARSLHWSLPGWGPQGDAQAARWFFNPFAWQLVFTLGAAAALAWRDARPTRSPLRVAAAATIVVVGAIVVSDGFGTAPGLQALLAPLLDSDKHELGLTRLVHFLSLAYLAAVLPAGPWLARTRLGQECMLWGRNALPIFVFGTFLSELCQLTMAASAVNLGLDPHAVGFAATLAGLVALSTQARFLEWQERHPGQGMPALLRDGFPSAVALRFTPHALAWLARPSLHRSRH